MKHTVAKPAQQFGHAIIFKTSLFIFLEIDQMSGWLRHWKHINTVIHQQT